MQDIARLLAYPLVIFSGDQDIDTGSEALPRHDAAMAQGPHRFARSQSFLEYGQAAATLGLPCNWRRVVVPGVAHEGMRMSDFAARYWFSPSTSKGASVPPVEEAAGDDLRLDLGGALEDVEDARLERRG